MLPDSQKIAIVTQTSQLREAVKSSIREIAFQVYEQLKAQWESGGTADVCQTEFFDPDSGEQMFLAIGRKPQTMEDILRKKIDG